MMKGKVGVIKPPRHLSPNIGKHMIIFVTILITTTGSKNCYISDAQNVITPAPPTCPGDSAVFTCAVTDVLGTQSTTWRIGSSTCELDHATPPMGDVYTSTLTVTAVVSLDKRNVECMFGVLVKEQRLDVIGKSTLTFVVHLLLGRACVHANWEHICYNYGPQLNCC